MPERLHRKSSRVWLVILPIPIFFFVCILVAHARVADETNSGDLSPADNTEDELSVKARAQLYNDPSKGPFWNKYFPDRDEATWDELAESLLLEYLGDNLSLDRNQMKKLAPHFDGNGDGHLSFEEFTAFVHNYVGGTVEVNTKTLRTALQEVLDVMRTLEFGEGGAEESGGRGCALSLSAKDSNYVELMNSGNLQFGGTQPFTLELWIKPSVTTKTPTLVSKYNRGKWGQYMVKLEPGGGVFFHREVAPWGLRTSDQLQANVFHHIAAVYNGKRSSIWVNGSMWVDQKEGAQDNDPQTPVLFGAVMDNSKTMDFFDGVIDEVRIWSVARTQEQLRAAMHLSLTGGEDGLAGYWPLDECAGERAKDMINERHGVLHGGEWVHSPVAFTTYHDSFGCVDALC